jgi:hypothetical protein
VTANLLMALHGQPSIEMLIVGVRACVCVCACVCACTCVCGWRDFPTSALSHGVHTGGYGDVTPVAAYALTWTPRPVAYMRRACVPPPPTADVGVRDGVHAV